MREMKDSGNDVIGEIPATWSIQRFKSFGVARNGLTYSPDDLTDESGTLVLRSSNVKDGKLSFADNVYVKGAIKRSVMLRGGDILICSRNGSRDLIGKNALISGGLKAAFGAFMMVYRTTENSKYMYYVLNSPVFSLYLGSFLTSTINQLTVDVFMNMTFPFCPDAEEQEKIAEFLDRKCGEIDEVRAGIETQIATLEEYKRSVISEAVTRGLDPEVPMKDSGIPWIGPIPSHWNIKKVKYDALLQSGEWGELPGVLAEDSDCVRIADFDYSRLRLRQGERTKRSYNFSTVNKLRLQSGDLLVEKSGGGEKVPVGRVVYVEDHDAGAVYTNFINRLRFLSWDSNFVCYVLSVAYAVGSIRNMFNQTTGIQNLNMTQFMNQSIPVPSEDEQAEIAEYLDRKCGEIDAVIATKREQLETLAEYRKSLIFEYVTGKKEVPAL